MWQNQDASWLWRALVWIIVCQWIPPHILLLKLPVGEFLKQQRKTLTHITSCTMQTAEVFSCLYGLFYHWSVLIDYKYNFISLVFCIYIYLQPNWSFALLMSIHSAWCEIKKEERNTLVKIFFHHSGSLGIFFGCWGSPSFGLFALGGDRVHNMCDHSMQSTH